MKWLLMTLPVAALSLGLLSADLRGESETPTNKIGERPKAPAGKARPGLGGAGLKRDGEAAGEAAPAVADLDALFRKLDANGDGKIDREEFGRLNDELKAVTPSVPTKRALPGGPAGKIDPERLKMIRDRIASKKAGTTPEKPESEKPKSEKPESEKPESEKPKSEKPE